MKAKILILSIVMLTLSGCETLDQLGFKKPAARIQGVQFGKVSLNAAELIFDVEVDNPYAVALPLNNLDYSLSSGDASLLAGSAKLQTSIPAKSTQSVSLPVSVNYLQVFQSLKGVRPGMTIPYKAGLGLSVNAPAVGPLTLPLKKEGTLALPEVTGTNVLNLLNAIKQ